MSPLKAGRPMQEMRAATLDTAEGIVMSASHRF